MLVPGAECLSAPGPHNLELGSAGHAATCHCCSFRRESSEADRMGMGGAAKEERSRTSEFSLC